MAGLLLMAMGCIPLAGCLFPQDQQVLGELPPKRNGRIRITAQSPKEPRTTFYNSTLCPSRNPAFQLTVEDEDLADTVSSLWFIGGTTSSPFSPSLLPGGTVGRLISAPNSLGFKSALANLPSGTEILTVYVSDTPFEEFVVGNTVQPVKRPLRTLPDGTPAEEDFGTMDSFTWTLEVEPCP